MTDEHDGAETARKEEQRVALAKAAAGYKRLDAECGKRRARVQELQEEKRQAAGAFDGRIKKAEASYHVPWADRRTANDARNRLLSEFVDRPLVVEEARTGAAYRQAEKVAERDAGEVGRFKRLLAMAKKNRNLDREDLRQEEKRQVVIEERAAASAARARLLKTEWRAALKVRDAAWAEVLKVPKGA